AACAWIWWPAGKKTGPHSRQIPKSVTQPALEPTNLQPASVPPPTTRAGVATNVPSTAPTSPARPVSNVFEAQLTLARQGISPGPIDGVTGSQTRAALRAFQQREKMPASGELDGATRARLTLDVPTYASYTITTNDLLRMRPLGTTWLAKSQQDRLDYETILELVAERAQSSPNLIRRLNPGIPWTNVVAGTMVQVPNVEKLSARTKAAFVRIHLAGKTLDAFDANSNLLAHFPC